jgi:hypothetical protein
MIDSPGQKGWQRYDGDGKLITPEEAHPGNPAPPEQLQTEPEPKEPLPVPPDDIPFDI